MLFSLLKVGDKRIARARSISGAWDRGRLLVLIVALVAALPLFFAGPGISPASPVNQLTCLGHFAYFALSAWALLRLPCLAGFGLWRKSALIVPALFLFGLVIEIVQPFFGRTASVRDLGINMLGVAFVLCFMVTARRTVPVFFLISGRAAVLGLCFAVFYVPAITLWDMHQAARQFPVLSDFETRFQHKRWSHGKIVQDVSRYGDSSLRVYLDNARQYPGTTMTHGFGNWQEYSCLALSIYNPEAVPLNIHISIRDQGHGEGGRGFGNRFDDRFEIGQGWHDLRIPVQDIKAGPRDRELDLSRLRSMVVFSMNLSEPRTIYLDNIQLLR